MANSKGKILVAMSGGVDSSVAAVLLQRRGYEVGGAYMMMLDSDRAREDAEQAKRVAEKIGIPFYCLDAKDIFRAKVQDYMANSYINGETPNPCIECNKKLKFGFFLDEARRLGYDKIATGHYAKICGDGDNLSLMRSGNLAKDQSYFIYHLSSEILAHVVFPLEDATKDEVREIAEECGFDNAHRRDSQDICFIENGNYMDFLLSSDAWSRKILPGKFVSIDGTVLGEHDGIARYTIGQRKGVRTAFGRPLYVKEKDATTNTVIMADDEHLWASAIEVRNFTIADKYMKQISNGPISVTAKQRYNQKDVPAVAQIVGDGASARLRVDFTNPQRAITPGQFLVMYDGEYVVGGGEIVRAL